MTELAQRKKKQSRIAHSADLKQDVIKSVIEDGVTPSDAAYKFNIKIATVYSWLQKVDKWKNINKNRRGKRATTSIADSIGVSKGIRKTKNVSYSNNSSNVNFCPCCGTNIQAVVVALETVNLVG